MMPPSFLVGMRHADPRHVHAGAHNRLRYAVRLHDLYVYPQVQALFAHVDPRTRDQSVVEGIFRELHRRLRQLATEAERYSSGPLGDAVFDAQSFSIVDCCLPGTLLLAERLAGILLLAQPPRRPPPPPLLGRGRLRRWLGAVRAHASLALVVAELEGAIDAWLVRKLSGDDGAFEQHWW
jgi:hypothetical protein